MFLFHVLIVINYFYIPDPKVIELDKNFSSIGACVRQSLESIPAADRNYPIKSITVKCESAEPLSGQTPKIPEPEHK